MNDEQGRWPGYRVDPEAFDRLADPDRTRKWGIAARFGREEAE
jgi:hypothetical protein